MALFGFGKKASAQAGPTSGQPNTESTQKVNLSKSNEALNKVVVNLKKDTGIDLGLLSVQAVVALDDSGSMRTTYQNGTVQNTLTSLLPFSLKFDDNGELEVYMFSSGCKKIKPNMTEENFEKYVANYIDKQHVYSSTNYAPVIKMIDNDFKKSSSKIPTLVFFITDGDNFDKTATDEAIRAASEHGIFYMFIGIGNERFDYLQKLDDLTGRKVDNTGFMKIQDLNTVSDDEIFLKSLKDFIP